MDVMRSVLGMVVLLTIAFLLSVNKKKISLRTVGAALVLQVDWRHYALVTARALGR